MHCTTANGNKDSETGYCEKVYQNIAICKVIYKFSLGEGAAKEDMTCKLRLKERGEGI